MIAIIDCGAGNLRSVYNALTKLGFAAQILSDPADLHRADRAILPGVGAFGACKDSLKKSGFIPAIHDFLQMGRPFLGICVGLQLLFSVSEEVFGNETAPVGLKLVPGKVRRFPATMGLKIPQIGWNSLRLVQPSPLWRGLPDGIYTYFVHSYYVEPEDDRDVLCTSDYGIDYCAGIQRGNLMGVQFHPEKSGQVGLTILKNFGEMSI